MVRSKKAALVVAAGVLTLGAGVGVASVAAADPTATPSAGPSVAPSASPDPGDRRERGHGGHGVGRFGADATALAEKLGVDEDRLREALRAVRDELRPDTPPSPGTDRPDREERRAAFVSALAEELGIDRAKVQAAVDELRAERQSERAAALKDRLDAAVADGTLTQAEADAVTKAVEKGVIGGGGHGPR